MSNELIIVLSIIWITGFISEVAEFTAKVDQIDESKKPEGWMIACVIFMFFVSWPYWFFYGRAKR